MEKTNRNEPSTVKNVEKKKRTIIVRLINDYEEKRVRSELHAERNVTAIYLRDIPRNDNINYELFLAAKKEVDFR